MTNDLRKTSLFAFGIGVGTQNSKSDWLEVFYPKPFLKPAASDWQVIAQVCHYTGGNACIQINKYLPELKALAPDIAEFANTQKPLVATFLETDAAPTSVPEAYLKLHLLSHRLVRPHGIDLNGVFKILPNVAWTSLGPMAPEDLPRAQLAARLKGQTLTVAMVDKFPSMTDYVIPAGVRIADTARVRLGAYVGEGTTVMQEGFINFNAGCEGPNMIEGRISAGVFVGAGSDLGGGCSTMGTLSGGNNIVISIGKNCLIGANAGVGIPLGDACTVEAGLYVTAAAKVRLVDRQGSGGRIVKARDLAGRSGLLFRRNSQTGGIECLPIKGAIELNADLHTNN